MLYILVATIGMKMDITAIFKNPGLFLIGFIWMLIHVIILLSVGKIDQSSILLHGCWQSGQCWWCSLCSNCGFGIQPGSCTCWCSPGSSRLRTWHIYGHCLCTDHADRLSCYVTMDKYSKIKSMAAVILLIAVFGTFYSIGERS